MIPIRFSDPRTDILKDVMFITCSTDLTASLQMSEPHNCANFKELKAAILTFRTRGLYLLTQTTNN